MASLMLDTTIPFGGYTDQAIEISDMFLTNEPISMPRLRHEKRMLPENDFQCPVEGKFEKGRCHACEPTVPR